MMTISNRFSFIFIFENQIFIRNFLSNINVTKDIIILDKFEFNIYTYDGIDFIIPEINLDKIDEIFKGVNSK